MRSYLGKVFLSKSQDSYIQFFRYGLVSVVALAIDFSGLVALKEYGHLHYLVAASISFIAGLLVNYFLSVAWVFQGSKLLNKRQEFTLFALIGIVGLALTNLILWVLTGVLGLFYVLSKVVATVIVYFWNFGARKKYLFH